MKIKSWVKYLIYVIFLCLLIFLREYYDRQLFSGPYTIFENPSFFIIAVISLLLGVFSGLFLGLEHLLREIGKVGIWKINLPKLILIGLPSLYFSLTNFCFISGIYFLQKIITYPLLYFYGLGAVHISLFQMILGYVIITSFSKSNEKT